MIVLNVLKSIYYKFPNFLFMESKPIEKNEDVKKVEI